MVTSQNKASDQPIRKRVVEDIPEPAMELAQRYVDFLNASPTKFQAIRNSYQALINAGFEELDLKETWNLKNGGKYFVVQNDSSLYSFVIGQNFQPGNPFAIVATHSDSPCLKIRPISNQSRHNYALIGSSLYGGGNWLTHFDREYKIAGKVYYRSQGKLVGKLVEINDPICYIANLAIHFTGYPPNLPDLEANLVPFVGLTNDIHEGDHRDELLQVVANQLQCQPSDIVEMDLHLVDHNPAKFVGIKKEFIAGQNQDNLLSTFTSIEALIRASNSSFLTNGNYVIMAINFDHEEVGNASPEGSETDASLEILSRISAGRENYTEAAQNSFVMSCDVAHALHPNYASLYEARNRCDIFGGMSIKYSPKLNYTTNAYTSTVAREVGRLANVPTQDFAVRNDARSGSTLGPEFSAKLGIASVDIGTTLLAMHSIRELSGTICVSHSSDYIQSFFENYANIKNMMDD